MRCIRGGRVTGPGAPPPMSPLGAELQAVREGRGVRRGPEPEAGPAAPPGPCRGGHSPALPRRAVTWTPGTRHSISLSHKRLRASKHDAAEWLRVNSWIVETFT